MAAIIATLNKHRALLESLDGEDGDAPTGQVSALDLDAERAAKVLNKKTMDWTKKVKEKKAQNLLLKLDKLQHLYEKAAHRLETTQNYFKLLAFLLFCGLYVVVLFLQRDSEVSYTMNSSLVSRSPTPSHLAEPRRLQLLAPRRLHLLGSAPFGSPPPPPPPHPPSGSTPPSSPPPSQTPPAATACARRRRSSPPLDASAAATTAAPSNVSPPSDAWTDSSKRQHAFGWCCERSCPLRQMRGGGFRRRSLAARWGLGGIYFRTRWATSSSPRRSASPATPWR